MTKIDIFSGFLGAGKTTLIKKLLEEGYDTKNLVLIENEFGEIGVDTGFLRNTGIQINEMVAGCICCTLVGDFGKALNEVITKYNPERILIEPSGVGKLSDVIIAIEDLHNENIELNSATTVVDARRFKSYMRNFGEFYINQIESAGTIMLSHIKGLTAEDIETVRKAVSDMNGNANIVTTDWDELTGEQILTFMESGESFAKTLSDKLEKYKEDVYAEMSEHQHLHRHDHDHDHEHEHHHHHHEHNRHDQDEHCECHHGHEEHHDHDENCKGHHGHHNHNDHDEHCDCQHEHHHHHTEDEHGKEHHRHEHGHHHHDCDEHCDCHHEHHHHHADEIFDEIGTITTNIYERSELKNILDKIDECGNVLRAKGIVEGADGKWLEFDYVPGESEIRETEAEATGMIVVIGTNINKEKIRESFRLI